MTRATDPRLCAALMRISGRELRRRCTAELNEFSSLRAKVEPSFYAALVYKLIEHFDADQVTLARAMARLNVSVGQIMVDDRLPAGASDLDDDDPDVTEFATRAVEMEEMFRDVLAAYQEADGCAGAMPERGRKLVLHVETATRAFKRAKLALLSKIRSAEGI